MSTNSNWFYIRSAVTGNVISAIPDLQQDYLRSQVIVTSPALNDFELWRWEGQFLVNKATQLVLDIRKGRLRLIEDTEICLYSKKSVEEAHNQLWAIKEENSKDGSCFIYCLCSNEWVLDVQNYNNAQKLVLFPLEPTSDNSPQQRWIFVNEQQLNALSKDALSLSTNNFSNSSSTTTASSYIGTPPSPYNIDEYPHALTPAKRGSHSTIFSVDSCKDFHHRVYSTQESNISDKGIAMAIAYHIFQNWKLDQISGDIMTDFPISTSNEIRTRLQHLTQNEVSKIFSSNICNSYNSKDTVLSISSRLITQFYEQAPLSP